MTTFVSSGIKDSKTLSEVIFLLNDTYNWLQRGDCFPGKDVYIKKVKGNLEELLFTVLLGYPLLEKSHVPYCINKLYLAMDEDISIGRKDEVLSELNTIIEKLENEASRRSEQRRNVQEAILAKL